MEAVEEKTEGVEEKERKALNLKIDLVWHSVDIPWWQHLSQTTRPIIRVKGARSCTVFSSCTSTIAAIWEQRKVRSSSKAAIFLIVASLIGWAFSLVCYVLEQVTVDPKVIIAKDRWVTFFIFLTFLKILVIFRQRAREWEREGEKFNVWLPLTHPYWGPGPQPWHVPWLGIQPATLWFAGQRSMHWATPARAHLPHFFIYHFKIWDSWFHHLPHTKYQQKMEWQIHSYHSL